MRTRIRAYRLSDTPTLAQLFFDSVRQGAVTVYTKEQVEAWAPAVPDSAEWAVRLERQRVVVAEDAHGITGFMTLDDHGYIDLAFVRHDRIGSGVGSALYRQIEKTALARGVKRLSSNASELARPMFERHGWVVVRTQEIDRCGMTLINHFMEKRLGRSGQGTVGCGDG